MNIYKVDDEVLVDLSNGLQAIGKVVRLTPAGNTVVRLLNEDKVFNKNGLERGGESARSMKILRLATEEDKARIADARKRVYALSRVRHFNDWAQLSTETLQSIVSLIDGGLSER